MRVYTRLNYIGKALLLNVHKEKRSSSSSINNKTREKKSLHVKEHFFISFALDIVE